MRPCWEPGSSPLRSQRPVRDSNPSRLLDRQVATPAASQGVLSSQGGNRTLTPGCGHQVLSLACLLVHHLAKQRKERESNPQGSSLVRVRAGCRRQSACPSVYSLDGWIRTSVVRLPKPADATRLSYIQIGRWPRPTKKARGRVTPGLLGGRPERVRCH